MRWIPLAVLASLLWLAPARAADASDPVAAAHAHLERGNALHNEGKAREAEAEFAKMLEIGVRAKDARIEADARYKIGGLQYDRGEMADALVNLQSAYRIYGQIGHVKGRLDALSDMANVYADSKVGQYDRAIEYYRQLLKGYAEHGQPNDVADTQFNIGSTFEAKGNLTPAEFHYRQALAEFEKLQRPDDIAFTKRSLGLALVKQNRAAEALPLFNAALAFYESKRSASAIAHVKQFRAMAYRRLGRLEESLRDLAAARRYYEEEANTRFLERNIEEAAVVYEQLGDWRNAYVFRTRHAALQRQLAEARRDELTSRLHVEFDAEKKEQENRALARENTLRAAALEQAQRNQKLQWAVLALTAFLATALALLFWRQLVNTRRMRAMAMTDELTRLPNRRHIFTLLEILFADAKRHDRPVALIVLDIDRFKRINDTYGHAAGDEVLKAVAHTCRTNLRPGDQLGRIGGEEFLIVLQTPTSAEQANDVAERLRASVERLDVSSLAPDLQITISLGVWIANEYDMTAAIAAADSLLYRAKESGRNRVEMAVA
ncbi:MAG TPA: tetratricopeptide repeat-containing diguanylate cyclase [Thermoanaerobaculia bacterium]|nr:tetratricopeptide repeat-containing diguanylate cyclase [Thermoanaerobaculia bacterium]